MDIKIVLDSIQTFVVLVCITINNLVVVFRCFRFSFCFCLCSPMVDTSTNNTCTASVPEDHYDIGYLYDSRGMATKYQRGAGIQDTDFILYVTYSSSYCRSRTLAWATPCLQDQYGRPISGTINFCPDKIIDTINWKQDVVTTLHEITHTLIMTPALWDDFIDSNGNTIPQSNVWTKKLLPNGYNQSYIITDKVKSLAQSYFDCYDESIMPGLPLEDDGSNGNPSSHWEVK